MTTQLPAKDLSRYQTSLRVALVLLIAYALCMVFAGRTVAEPLFNALNFGPSRLNDEIAHDYSIFTFGVLGAVIVGWATSMWVMLDFMDAKEYPPKIRSKARNGLLFSIGFWFLLDTGFSIAVNEWEHAAFNFPFAICLAIPLYIMKTPDIQGDPKSE
jgi:hypothetical protein